MANGWFISMPSNRYIKKISLYLTLFWLTGLIGSATMQTSNAPIDFSSIDSVFWTVCDTLVINDGDIVLRRGRTLASDLVTRFSGGAEGMSHCGIIIRHQDKWQVVHTISGMISDEDNIRITSLPEFINEAAQGRITIKRQRSGFGSVAVKDRSIRLLQLKIPFDHAFDLNTKSRLYCTQLIREVFVDAGSHDFFHYGSFAGKPVLEFSTFFDPLIFHTVVQTY